MILWLVRHADPIVPAGVCYGRWDVPAQPESTQRAAAALAQELPPATRGHYSPLLRCEQLAQAVQRLRPDVVLQADARLMELDFGAWEARRWQDIPQSDYDAWTQHFAHYRPGGGESLQAMLGRVGSAWQQAQERSGPQVWITHAGVARCVQWLHAAPLGALPRASEWTAPAPAFGAWQRYGDSSPHISD